MSGSGYTCIRCIFCWFNCILWVIWLVCLLADKIWNIFLCLQFSGCGIFGVGIWLRLAYEGYISLMPQYAILSADSLCIAVGVITFVLSLFGCCGALFQNKCLLITVRLILNTYNLYYSIIFIWFQYFIFLVLMFETEFFLGILAFIFQERLANQLRWELRDGIQHHYNLTDPVPNNLVTIWDKVHREVIW